MAGWDALHPMELAGHLSSATIIFILLAMLVSSFVILCCCKARIRGIFRPVPAPIERDYHPLSSVDRDSRLPQYSTLPPGARRAVPVPDRRRLEPEYHHPPSAEGSQPEADQPFVNTAVQSPIRSSDPADPGPQNPIRPSEDSLNLSSVGFTDTHDAQLVNTVTT